VEHLTWLGDVARLGWNGTQLKTAFQLQLNFVPIGLASAFSLPGLDGTCLIKPPRVAGPASRRLSSGFVDTIFAVRRPEFRPDWNDFGTIDGP
jgi:hypothetical protein